MKKFSSSTYYKTEKWLTQRGSVIFERLKLVMKTIFNSTYNKTWKWLTQRGSAIFEITNSAMKLLFSSTHYKIEVQQYWKNEVGNEKNVSIQLIVRHKIFVTGKD